MPPPPRRAPQEESESSGDDDQGQVMDFARFTNPNYAREFKAKLPEKIRDRVKALEALDEDYKKLRLELRTATEAVEREFQAAILPHAQARLKILKGEVEPTDEEVKEGLPAEDADQIHLEGALGGTKGIPNFWLQALQHHVIIREFITERDAEALAFLEDIQCQMFEGAEEGYTVVFKFAPNPFFSNETLSKTFTLARQQDDIVLSKATGTKVEWKEGKNLGLRTVTKKVKSKAKKGQTKFVTSEEPCDTFFDFFSVPAPDEAEEGQEEEWMALADTLKDKIIPFAVDYFTGDAPNGESDLEDDDDYGDEEEEEEEEEDVPPPTRGGRGGYSAPAPKRGGAGGRGGQQDCKQQ